MRALLLKDFYTVVGELRFLLILLVVFALFPGAQTSGIAAIYAIMLPYTAVAYEERSRWNRYAAMLPYTPRTLVCEKYALGWITLAAINLISAASLGVTGLLGLRDTAEPDALLVQLAIAGAALVLLALQLPLVFRYGPEKGRMFFLLLAAAAALGFFLLAQKAGAEPVIAAASTSSAPQWQDRLIVVGLPVLGIAAQPISIAVSARFFRRRNRT